MCTEYQSMVMRAAEKMDKICHENDRRVGSKFIHDEGKWEDILVESGVMVDMFITTRKRPEFVNLLQLLDECLSGFQCEHAVVVYAFALVDRLISRVTCDRRVNLCYYNCSNIIGVAMVIAVKQLEDAIFAMTHYAHMLNTDVHTLVQLESTFCTILDFDVHIDSAVWQKYRMELSESSSVDVLHTPCPRSISRKRYSSEDHDHHLLTILKYLKQH